MKTATLRLFNAIQVDDVTKTKAISEAVQERMVANGYMLHPAINPMKDTLKQIESVVGLSGEKANAAFHKSWSVIKEASMEALVAQQIVHYITTYGFEELGIFSHDSIYIPKEELNLPAIKSDIPLTVIKAMTSADILEAIIKLASGVALSKESLNDIMTIVQTNKYKNTFVEQINNRELKALLNDYYNIVPTEPVEFLRHLISKLTDDSLLIKNNELITKIKEANGKFLDALLKDAPDDLASIFFRYKPLFLAMKTISKNKTYFNQLRKKADTLHQPLAEDYLNSITSQIKKDGLDLDVFKTRIETASIFRKIRLAYALHFRLYGSDAIVYKVRNGRGWASGFDWPVESADLTYSALEIVITSIVQHLREKVEGKTIYIPEHIHYALPATEKQFTGNFPTGSSVTVPEDLIVGIHWSNTNKRVDLDLSVIGESGKFGWDSHYRSKGKDVLFSGDVTDAPAPKGASELFYLTAAQDEAKILMVNYYNHEKGDEVETKLLVANEKPKNFGENYMVNVNNMIAAANINISKKQNILGLIANKNNQNRVYFANVSIGNSITSHTNEQSIYTRKYLVDSVVNSIDLEDILISAGAMVTDKRGKHIDYDLAPEKLTKTSILDLFS